jgi:hypothetical protein
MKVPRYTVVSEIRGLEEPKKPKGGGAPVEHVLQPGAKYETTPEIAKPFVDGGSLTLDGQTDAEAEAARKVAADAEAKRRAALTPEQRKAEDDAAAQGGK